MFRGRKEARERYGVFDSTQLPPSVKLRAMVARMMIFYALAVAPSTIATMRGQPGVLNAGAERSGALPGPKGKGADVCYA